MNYSLKDAFRSLRDLEDENIELPKIKEQKEDIIEDETADYQEVSKKLNETLENKKFNISVDTEEKANILANLLESKNIDYKYDTVDNDGDISFNYNLNESLYDINDDKEVEKAKEVLDDNKNKENVEEVIDLDSDTVDQIQDGYIGKALLQCISCQQLIYKDIQELIKEDETYEDENGVTQNIYNKNLVCPHCGSETGYKLIGQVGKLQDENEENIEDNIEDNIEVDSDNNGEEVDLDAEIDMRPMSESIEKIDEDNKETGLIAKLKSIKVKEDLNESKETMITENEKETGLIAKLKSIKVTESFDTPEKKEAAKKLKIMYSKPNFKEAIDTLIDIFKEVGDNETVENIKKAINGKLDEDVEVLPEVEITPDSLTIETVDSDEDKIAAIETTIKNLIKSEWTASDEYKSAISSIKNMGENEFDNIIKVLEDINSEELVHVGQLEEILTTITNNHVDNQINDGKEEAKNQLNSSENTKEIKHKDINIEDIDKESFEESIKNYLKENYDNIEDFGISDYDIIDDDCVIKVTGKVHYNDDEDEDADFDFNVDNINEDGDMELNCLDENLNKNITLKCSLTESKLVSK